MSDSPTDAATRKLGRRLLTGVAVVFIGGVVIAVGRNILEARALAAETASRQTPVVAVTSAHATGEATAIDLPGTVSAFNEAALLARTSGYVRRWHAELGQKVAAGAVLVELEAPDLDQELAQARATLAQARASAELARATAARWAELRRSDAVSQQEADDKASAASELENAARAAAANVGRLEETAGFKQVRAPFAGVIVRRAVEVGQLVSAGAGTPLYVLQQTDPVRVFVNVAQADVGHVPVGSHASIEMPDRPGKPVTGTVTRVAGALDPASRTRLAEIDVPNRDGTLLPGAYARVKLASARAGRGTLVPNTALLFRAEGPRIAVVGSDSRVSLRAVTLGADNGKEVEVLTGVSAGDVVVTNPPDALVDGDVVRTVKK
jgi:RND family efflux transporter MFP subunit